MSEILGRCHFVGNDIVGYRGESYDDYVPAVSIGIEEITGQQQQNPPMPLSCEEKERDDDDEKYKEGQ
jgi:hypothetical protein